ncbi:MAG: hypothetical protein J6I98_03715 [Clostridia bacterium]|nr:hypothetical protein [Clostridia bacterium]
MQINTLAEKLGWKLLTDCDGADRTAEGCYCGDLLSWVMGRAKADDVWLTVMGNINAIAVATLADVSAIVLVENAPLDEEARMRANQQEVAIYATELPAYETAMQIAEALK